MAADHSIPPFPLDIDRRDFANWLSGFVDGEGHFGLQLVKSRRTGNANPQLCFSLALRADEEEILRLIQAFWQCGKLYWNSKRQKATHSPEVRFSLYNAASCHNILLPHFATHPLRAKKRRDFIIWKEAVELCYHVHLRSPRPVKRRGGAGILHKWLPDEHERFMALFNAIKAQRVFRASVLPIPPPLSKGPSLFDGLH